MDGLLKLPVGLLSLVGLDYWLGYCYSKAYFGNFNISLGAASIPIEQYFVQGTVVFASALVPDVYRAPNYILLICSIAWLVAFFAPTERLKSVRTFIIWGAAIPIVMTASLAAIETADADIGRLNAKPAVLIALERDAAPASMAPPAESASPAPAAARTDILSEFERDNDAGALRMVWQDADAAVLAAMKENCSAEAGRGCVARVYRLGEDEIRLSRWIPKIEEESE